MASNLIKLSSIKEAQKTTMKRRTLIILLFFLKILSFDQLAAEVNLALNKQYSMSPTPNYNLCTEKGDKYQLTDSKISNAHWAKKSTVGWHWPVQVPQVIIDLGRIEAIDKVNIHTSCGTKGGVKLPEYAVVYLSNDGNTYQVAGFSQLKSNVREVASHKEFYSYWFSVNGIQSKGRYVKIIIQPGGSSFFTDEIEIMRLEGPSNSKADSSVSVSGDIMDFLSPVQKRLELIDAIEHTTTTLSNNVKMFSQQTFSFLTEELKILRGSLNESNLKEVSDKKLTNISVRLGQARAKIYQQYYKRPIAIIPADPMARLINNEIFLLKADGNTKLLMWQNEYEPAAFNIVNGTDDTIRVSVSFSPLAKDQTIIPSEQFITIRQAEYVYALDAGQVADVLVLLGDRSVSVEPGQVRQVWITVNSTDLAPGKYAASVAFRVLSPVQQSIRTMPLEFKVYPLKMPRQMTLNTYNWAYPNLSPVTKHFIREVSQDLQTHYVNTFMIHIKNLPFPSNAAAANRPLPPSAFVVLDDLIKSNPYVRTYLLLLGFNSVRKDSGRFGQWMSDSWKQNFERWLRQITGHLKNRGIGYERFALYPYDENVGDDFFELVKFVKQVDPNIRIFANSYGRGPTEFMRFSDLIDIWCLNQGKSISHPSWLEKVRTFGKEIWCYGGISPAKAADPFDSYRKKPWWAFKNNFTGAGFWCYADTTSNRWDDYGLTKGHCAVVYSASNAPVTTMGENIIPSRRWQAWREGVEDYQYLMTLQMKINQIKKISPEKAAKLQDYLDDIVTNVLSDSSSELRQFKEQITLNIVELDALLN
jgi:hypothetical protein